MRWGATFGSHATFRTSFLRWDRGGNARVEWIGAPRLHQEVLQMLMQAQAHPCGQGALRILAMGRGVMASSSIAATTLMVRAAGLSP